jgi:hypothetical protein
LSATALPIRGAGYNKALREFVLPYDEVQLASSPDALLLEFLEHSYSAAATLGKWDRAALEYRCPSGDVQPERPPHSRR